MGRKIIILLLGLSLTTSCLLVDPYESKVEEEIILQGAPKAEESAPSEFTWETMVYQEIEINNTNTSVLNRAGEVIAEDLPIGKYLIPKNSDDSLQCMQITYVTMGMNSEEDITISFPSEEGMGSFMVEDLFPYQGDKDFNDIVFNYSIKYFLVGGTNNKVSKMQISVLPKAMGGNAEMVGIGLKFNSFQGKIAKVTGASSMEGSFFSQLAANGTEEGQTSCTVVPLVGDIRSLFASRKGFLNTFASLPQVESSMVTVEIEFEQGSCPDYSEVVNHIGSTDMPGGVSFFVTVDSRGKEIFTKGNAPTDKFDFSLFKATGREDFSNEDNFVWAIQNASQIDYPQEMVSIFEAYPKFINWVNSLGIEDNDWYQSPEMGKIFNFAI